MDEISNFFFHSKYRNLRMVLFIKKKPQAMILDAFHVRIRRTRKMLIVFFISSNSTYKFDQSAY